METLERACLWLVVMLVVGCSEVNQPISPSRQQDVQIALALSSPAAQPGQQITVAIDVESKISSLVGVQGILQFDPSQLRYAGQIPVVPTLVMVNQGAENRGLLKLLS